MLERWCTVHSKEIKSLAFIAGAMRIRASTPYPCALWNCAPLVHGFCLAQAPHACMYIMQCSGTVLGIDSWLEGAVREELASPIF
eukprot:1095268-Pelagomonas_calceolata.AAC.2